MNPREKSMLIVTVMLVIILILKSFIFDEVKNLSGEEKMFKDFVEYSVAQEYDGILQQYNIITYRVFDIFVADETQNTIIRYKDPETGEDKEEILSVRYTGRVRAYLLGFLPFKQFSVTAQLAPTN
ncbi:MAG: hypothetical protein GX285_08390 [Clostridiales bacterium]|nr:hypothetical protein [Clostridiales bacterium]